MNQIGKKMAFVGAFLAVGLSSIAYADTIRIVTKVDNIVAAGNNVMMEKEVVIPATSPSVVVEVAGKKCTFGTSAQGSVPMGCNYSIIIDNTGVKPAAREANAICMKTPMKCE